MYSYGACVFASVITIGVPQQFLDQKSSLVLCMLDSDGNQSVGKCCLDADSAGRNILQTELKITTCKDVDCFDGIADLTDFQGSDQNLVLLNFELDPSLKLLRVLVVKSSFLEENPFDVVTVKMPANQFTEFGDDDDALSLLVAGVDETAVEASILKQESQSLLEQYKLYAEIYVLMKYSSMKRALSNMSSWLLSSN
jgi:hypothetical protein